MPRKRIAQPLYQKIKKDLTRRIIAGEWRAGDCLPSEIALAKHYKASQGTVRRAVEELANDGLINRHAGRGTFINSHEDRHYERFNFHRLISDSGSRVADQVSTFLTFERVSANSSVANALQIEEGDPGIQFLRIRHFNEKPVLLEQIFFADQLCPDLAELINKHRPHSIYLLLEQHCHILVTRVKERLMAVSATESEASYLNIPVGTAVLQIERVAIDVGGRAVEWRLMTAVTSDVYFNCSST